MEENWWLGRWGDKAESSSRITTFKLLGVYVYDDLKWPQHFKQSINVRQKVDKRVGRLRAGSIVSG